jgi:6-phosphogluconolactonase (cycloisomerase 2 family)
LDDRAVGEAQYNGPTANGTNLFFENVTPFGGYNITVRTQPTNPSQTCVVANGIGSPGVPYSHIDNISVTCTTNTPRFVYVTNGGSNNVSAYTVEATSGALTAISGSPFAAGSLPVAVAVDPTGAYVYVANQTDATVSAFTVDRMSGALTAVSGSPFATGPAPTSVAIDTSGSFVYVTSGNGGTVWAYAIGVGGALVATIHGSPFAAGTSPSSVTVAPQDANVYVANQGDGTVSVFTIEVMGGIGRR